MAGLLKQFIRAGLAFVYKFSLRAFRGRGLTKIWPIGAARDWISAYLRSAKPEKMVFRGQTIYLDPNDNLELSIWSDKEHPFVPEIKVIDDNVSPGDVAVDVGANVGLVTLFIARATGSTGKVFAFEPALENVALLEKNVGANRYGNVTIVQKAVSDTPGKLKLFLSDFNVGDHRIYDPEEKIKELGMSGAEYEKIKSERRKFIKVETITLDDFFADSPRVDFVKIDVQGAEGAVLKGMKRVIDNNPDIKVLMEFWPAGLKMFGVGAEEVIGFLTEKKFYFYEISGGVRFVSSPAELLRKYTAVNNRGTNLLLRRRPLALAEFYGITDDKH